MVVPVNRVAIRIIVRLGGGFCPPSYSVALGWFGWRPRLDIVKGERRNWGARGLSASWLLIHIGASWWKDFR